MMLMMMVTLSSFSTSFLGTMRTNQFGGYCLVLVLLTMTLSSPPRRHYHHFVDAATTPSCNNKNIGVPPVRIIKRQSWGVWTDKVIQPDDVDGDDGDDDHNGHHDDDHHDDKVQNERREEKGEDKKEWVKAIEDEHCDSNDNDSTVVLSIKNDQLENDQRQQPPRVKKGNGRIYHDAKYDSESQVQLPNSPRREKRNKKRNKMRILEISDDHHDDFAIKSDNKDKSLSSSSFIVDNDIHIRHNNAEKDNDTDRTKGGGIMPHSSNQKLLRIPCSLSLTTSNDYYSKEEGLVFDHAQNSPFSTSGAGAGGGSGNSAIPVAAFIDTGAEVTILTLSTAKKLQLAHLIDRGYSGQATGMVGKCNIVGRIPANTVHIHLRGCAYTLSGKTVTVRLDNSPAMTVLQDDICNNEDTNGIEMLIGLDALEEWGATICLRESTLTVRRKTKRSRRHGIKTNVVKCKADDQEQEEEEDVVIPFIGRERNGHDSTRRHQQLGRRRQRQRQQRQWFERNEMNDIREEQKSENPKRNHALRPLPTNNVMSKKVVFVTKRENESNSFQPTVGSSFSPSLTSKNVLEGKNGFVTGHGRCSQQQQWQHRHHAKSPSSAAMSASTYFPNRDNKRKNYNSLVVASELNRFDSAHEHSKISGKEEKEEEQKLFVRARKIRNGLGTSSFDFCHEKQEKIMTEKNKNKKNCGITSVSRIEENDPYYQVRDDVDDGYKMEEEDNSEEEYYYLCSEEEEGQDDNDGDAVKFSMEGV